MADSPGARANNPAFADEGDEAPVARRGPPALSLSPGRPWSAGVFTLWKTERYRGVRSRWVTVPVVAYRGERLQVTGPRLRVRLWQAGRWEAWGTGSYRFEGHSTGDGRLYEGLSAPRDTVEGGLQMIVGLPSRSQLQLEVAHDLLDRHGGGRLQLGALRRYFWRGNGLTLQSGLQWIDSSVADYYYGVAADDAREDRPAYSFSAPSWTVSTQAGIFRPVGRRWQILVNLGVERDGSSIRSSPITDGGIHLRGLFSITRSL